MFKKLKQKINEEQSPQRNAQSPQQAQVSPGDRRASFTASRPADGPVSPSNRELLAGMIAEPAFLSEYTIFALDQSKRPKTAQVASVTALGSRGGAGGGVPRSPRGSINGDGSASPQREEPQSFAQKLQLKVPSVESLLRTASRAEGLFRSPSRESLVRSASRDSLTPQGEEPGASPAYDPPSDIESEAEEGGGGGTAEAMSTEQLLHRLHRTEKSLGNYRGKYSELVTAYRSVQRDKEKTQAILSQSQDKALRRIGELREELQMDQQAKKHLQEEFDAVLEEKDQMISVLQTQVSLMKKRMKGVQEGEGGGGPPPDGEQASPQDAADTQSPSTELGGSNEGSTEPGRVEELLQQRVRRQENLLQRCKEMLKVHKERSAQLTSENETLQQQLQERLQELEKTKELHTTEKTKLITQLRDAKNLIEQLEQDKGMVIAETKRQMHETLEMKEEEISRLRSRVKMASAQREELQEQKERSDKAAFEELERALGVAQRAEEARRLLQSQLEEQVKQVELAGEEERRSLQMELSRVKQEVVTIMKKSSEEKVAEMERLHIEALATKEQELIARISQAVEQCKEDSALAAREREQQAALALEDAELQKAAVAAEAENKAQDIRLELERARTRILELESSLERGPQEGLEQPEDLASQLEELRVKHQKEMAALQENHREEVERVRQEQASSAQEHSTSREQLVEQHKLEVESLEREFQAHAEDMNQKTVEKLDTKQAELEGLISELAKIQRNKKRNAEKLASRLEAGGSAMEGLERRLQEEQVRHMAEMEKIGLQHQQTLGDLEKTLKGELNALKIVLEAKEKELEAKFIVEKGLKQKSEAALQDRNAKVQELEKLRLSLKNAESEKEVLKESNSQLTKIREELVQSRSVLKDLEHQLKTTQVDCHQKEESLQQNLKQLQAMEVQLQQTRKELSDKMSAHVEELDTVREEEKKLRKQLDDQKATHEKKTENTRKETEGKLKAQEAKMEKFKQKAKEMQEKFKKKLQENEEARITELAKKDAEHRVVVEQVKQKIMEMSQQSSQGLNDTMTELEANHKQELEKLHQAHHQDLEGLKRRWQEKLGLQEEEAQEKHAQLSQDKGQELEDTAQQLARSREELEQALQEMKDLREGLAIRETTVQKLQEELKETASQLDSLSQGELRLKQQVEAVERNFNQALNERNCCQDRLTKTEVESREKLKALANRHKDAEQKLQALEASMCKEGGDLQRRLEESALQLQAKENELTAVRKQLEHTCLEVQAKMERNATKLCQRVEGRVNELKDRVLCNQKKVAHLQNFILAKMDRICTLEKSLRQRTEENQNLCSSLEQFTTQLNAHAEHTQALTAERDSLMKDAENHAQALSEKVLRIEQLSRENNTISENVKANASHISNLESIISDLKTQLAGNQTGKDEAISLLGQQHKEEKQVLVSQMEERIEKLDKQKIAALEQADTLRNNLAEFKRKAESKFTQNHGTVKALQARLEAMERQIAEKDENLQRLTASVDNQSISKSEMDQALSEKEQKVSKLTTEVERCNRRLSELEEQLAIRMKECEQLTADLRQQLSVRESERRELSTQLQQTQDQSSQNGQLVQATEEKLTSLEKENQSCKQKLERQREEFEKTRAEMLKNQEERLKASQETWSAESAGKVSELKKKAEQKIAQIRKQLSSQLEEKEQSIKTLRGQLEEMNAKEVTTKQQMAVLKERSRALEKETEQADKSLQVQLEESEQSSKTLRVQLEEVKEKEATMRQQMGALEERGRTLEEALAKLREEQEKQLEQIRSGERLERESSLQSLKDMYEEKLSSLQRESSSREEGKANEVLSRIEDVERKLNEAEERNTNLLAEISHLKEDLAKRTAQVEQSTIEITSLEKRLHGSARLENTVHADQCTPLSVTQDGSEESLGVLQGKLTEASNEKQKLQKDFNRLQKDLRSLRKEHEQELEYLKKELAEESKKNLKLEMEDMESKHNSALKHLMREFNTQMALREKELDTAVKETIGKAQSVEAELMECHREEASELQKVIAQKEDDLHRTVQRYEEVLQSREEEMGDRVWQVQKELEELQARTQGSTQLGVDELQAQLGEKTTLLSEARLKEQALMERMHSLEDKMRCVHKNSVVTHLTSSYRDTGDGGPDAFSEHTEIEYLRKVLFEYMMGRETKTMAKVITSMLKFSPDQAQEVLQKEEARATVWLR